MKGCLVTLVALFVFLLLAVELPIRLVEPGLEDFEGRERKMASRALADVATFYGNGFLEIGDYNGPPLVLGWYVKSVEKCPPPPSGEKIEKDSYRSFVGANAKIGTYSLFGIPRGEMELTCGGHRKWKSYF